MKSNEIDVNCKECGTRMFSILPENIVGPTSLICEECRIKNNEKQT